MIEANPHAMARVLDTRDGIAEDRFDLAVQRTVDRSCKVGAPKGGEAAVKWAPEYLGREAAARAAMPIHEAHLPHLVTQVPYLGEEAHLFGDVVADAPEVVHETAAAK